LLALSYNGLHWSVGKGHATISVERKRFGSRLTRTQEAFCLEYLANGHNASKAYKATHPGCKSDLAARVEGHRHLTNPNVRAFLEQERSARNARLRMTGDEAMALLALIARANIGDIYDEHGNVMPVPHWPETVRLAVRTVRHGRRGISVTMQDSLRACELIAIATGRLRSTAHSGSSFDHAAYLAGLDEQPGAPERRPPARDPVRDRPPSRVRTRVRDIF
jgi:phage terminase small subunit